MFDRTGRVPCIQRARHRTTRRLRPRSINAPMNGQAVRLAINVVTTMDKEVAAGIAPAAYTTDDATHTAAAMRAGRAGNGRRNQRWLGALQ
ncbi:hypothetical protein LFL96_29710 [Paraburkholderia sp. D15]|uniref:hypothetical protein n=1 Tax=Paraburkholderia sp. D15 TaxID=2880218 RepID=UPI00247A61B7|nr:hypothetical protein [Paraburkholderia sp. D15]WGS52375.1 hypothetical protein LFL96_29710 [Paraburkholderia sp. D15]